MMCCSALLPALLAVIACLSLGKSEADGQDRVQWTTLKGDFYRLHYDPSHEVDAKKAQRFLEAAIDALRKEFDGLPVHELLKVDCQIFLHPQPNQKASEHVVQIQTSRQGATYVATIDLLTLSAYDPKYRSNVSLPADDDYWQKLIMHEYSTVLLDRITQHRGKGWTFFEAPRWFVDGYEEYLGLMHTSPKNRTATLAKYLTFHKQNPNRIDFEFGVSVTDAYLDGAILLLFMHETFGKERVQAILKSTEPRFGRAITTALGVSLDEYQKKWETWRKQRLR